MNHCDTCKHWIKDEKTWLSEESLGLRQCKAVVMLFDATKWSSDGSSRCLKDENANKKAFVQDASDYMAYLYTLPTFGCVQHEDT